MTIKIIPYCKSWASCFSLEKKLIVSSMEGLALRVEHVGSTSIPNMSAKDSVDIQISVNSLNPLSTHIKLLKKIKYEHVPLPAPPPDSGLNHADEVYPYFNKLIGNIESYHIHLCTKGSIEERNHIIFRDYLKDNHTVAAEYLELKQSLAMLHVSNNPNYRENYSLGKTEFIKEIIDRAIASGYRI